MSRYWGWGFYGTLSFGTFDKVAPGDAVQDHDATLATIEGDDLRKDYYEAMQKLHQSVAFLKTDRIHD